MVQQVEAYVAELDTCEAKPECFSERLSDIQRLVDGFSLKSFSNLAYADSPTVIFFNRLSH